MGGVVAKVRDVIVDSENGMIVLRVTSRVQWQKRKEVLWGLAGASCEAPRGNKVERRRTGKLAKSGNRSDFTANHKLNKGCTETKTYKKHELTQHTHHLVIY